MRIFTKILCIFEKNCIFLDAKIMRILEIYIYFFRMRIFCINVFYKNYAYFLNIHIFFTIQRKNMLDKKFDLYI